MVIRYSRVRTDTAAHYRAAAGGMTRDAGADAMIDCSSAACVAAAARQFTADRASLGNWRAGWLFLTRLARAGWHFARQVSGDDAYERYLAHTLRMHPAQPPLSRTQYFKLRQDQKWSRISRCC